MNLNNITNNGDTLRKLSTQETNRQRTSNTGEVTTQSGKTIAITQPNNGGTVRKQPPLSTKTASTSTARQDLGIRTNLPANQPPAGNLQISQPRNFPHETSAPAFTFADLDNMSKGTYNVGELRLTNAGKLEKINNHVWVKSGENTIRLTPEQNFNVRDKVCQCLERKFPSSNLLESTIRPLLIGTEYRSQALSRDEIRFLITMLENERDGKPQGDYTCAKFLMLHEYKMGSREHENLVESLFVKGVATAGEKNDAKALGIARAVSANARQGVVATFLAKIKAAVRALFNAAEKVDYNEVQNLVRRQFCSEGTNPAPLVGMESKPVYFSIQALDTLIKKSENAAIFSDDFQPQTNQPVDANFWNTCKAKVGEKFIEQLGDLHTKHKDLKIQLKQSPFDLLLILNAAYSQKQSTAIFLRQTPGSNMCFFNCVVNGMLHAAAKMGNEAYKNKLIELFSMNGCKLRNPNGADVTYSYEQLPSWNGKFNILEQHVVNHIDNCNRNLPRNQKWEALSIMTALKMLGLREQTEWNNPGNWNLPPEFQPAEVAAMSPKDKILAFLKDLQKGPEKNMLFAFVEQVPLKSDSHYYTLCPPESADLEGCLVYDESGSNLIGVKVHVISDRADGPQHEYEYDKVLSVDELFGRTAETLDFTAYKLP